MKKLPKGNYAMCIAHPGHELRLHGFLEQAGPFVFILTDGSSRTGMDMMMDSIRVIDTASKQGRKITMGYMKSSESKKIFKRCMHDAPEGQQHLKDFQIHSEILNGYTDLFQSQINFIADNLIKYNINYLVSDASEGYNVCHEINRIMADIAIKLVKKRSGKDVQNYDFAIYRPYNEGIDDSCIHIQLDDLAVNRKLNSIIKYPLAITDLKPNISLDLNVIIELGKMADGREQIKALLKEINSGFLYNEYLRPYVFKEPTEKPVYELNNEKEAYEVKYHQVITYNDNLKPMKEKLEKLVLSDGN